MLTGAAYALAPRRRHRYPFRHAAAASAWPRSGPLARGPALHGLGLVTGSIDRFATAVTELERSPARLELTPSERRVVALAAEGLTNRRIAQQLFVTTATVATHLRHAFRKLGVRSRAELPERLPG